MASNQVQRRKQFSSCDSCRKSRVACDALHRDTSIASCTRCAARNKSCSFEWMRRISSKPNRSNTARYANRLPSRAPAYATTRDSCLKVESPRRNLSIASLANSKEDEDSVDGNGRETRFPPDCLRSMSEDISDWLGNMYEDVFESVFGSWLGNYSCPFAFGERGQLISGENEQMELSLSVSISWLCRRFDHLMGDWEKHGYHRGSIQSPILTESSMDWQIERTLKLAIQTFSARWLPLTFPRAPEKAAQTPLIQNLWRELRKELPRTMNRPCYRSMLSLYLYAMVPVPVGIPEDEEENGLPAQVCVQAALQQVQFLRARQRTLEFNGSKVSLLSDQTTPIPSPEQTPTEFLVLEGMIYWAATTFDTSAALTHNTKPLLTSGLLGWESEAPWRLVKTCTNIFHEQSENWRSQGVLVTEETANQIIAAAQAWKLRGWKMGTILKEALREGHGEEAVHHAYTYVVDAIQQFNITYQPLLGACERRLQFLSQYTKLRWYELMVHHYLWILITIDAVEIASQQDILKQMSITRSEVEGSMLNVLKFGLDNAFTIPKRSAEQEDGSFPLIAIDPYPHHVVAGVQLLWKGIQRELDAGNLDRTASGELQSILLQVLELLPQSSNSVRKATEQAQLALMSSE